MTLIKPFAMPFLFIAALLAGGLWWVNNMERVTEERYLGFQGEAKRNDYLAAERFLRATGMTVESINSLEKLRELPPSRDVLFVPTQRLTFGETRTETLMNWVAAGGHLIVVGWALTDASGHQAGRHDPLLRGLGVEQLRHNSETIDRETHVPTNLVIGDAFLQVAFLPDFFLVDHSGNGHVLAEDDYGAHVLQFQIGNGTLTVMTDSRFLMNHSIDTYDHASSFWWLVQHNQSAGKVWLVYNENMPSLWHWLVENAPAVLISAGILLIAWLWYAGLRFGPVLPAPAPIRRSLLEHVYASGRFLWTHRAEDRLLDCVRQSLKDRLTVRHPGQAALPRERLRDILAERSGLDAERIERALIAGAEHRPLVFVQLMNDLETLRKRL